MKALLRFFLLIILLTVSCGGEKFPLPVQELDFIATLDVGQQEPPVAVASNGTGSGLFTLDAEELSYTIIVSVPSLTGPITAAHFHSGSAGIKGEIIRDIFADFTDGVATGTWTLTSDLATALVEEEVYVDVHTAANEQGEIRGQLLLGGTTAVGDTTYIQLTPVWDDSTGYDFNQPSDILLGREPLIYIADTGNDRILMLDLAGNVLPGPGAQSQPVENPVALTQDSKLNLFIVTDSNKIFKIDLVAVNHDINSAPVELVYEEVDNPDRRFTGIAARLRSLQGQTFLDYIVTATGNDKVDNKILIFQESFRRPDSFFESNGLGILSASSPSGVTAVRDFSEDFIYTMTGENFFKVQWITTSEFGFTVRLNPAAGNFDLMQAGKFSEPEDVTVDPEGSIYVVDADLNFMFKFSSSGEELQSFGGSGDGVKQLNSPHGIAFFDKTLYVADTANNRIVRYKLSTDIGN